MAQNLTEELFKWSESATVTPITTAAKATYIVAFADIYAQFLVIRSANDFSYMENLFICYDPNAGTWDGSAIVYTK